MTLAIGNFTHKILGLIGKHLFLALDHFEVYALPLAIPVSAPPQPLRSPLNFVHPGFRCAFILITGAESPCQSTTLRLQDLLCGHTAQLKVPRK